MKEKEKNNEKENSNKDKSGIITIEKKDNKDNIKQILTPKNKISRNYQTEKIVFNL
jgi:hypothetical protein